MKSLDKIEKFYNSLKEIEVVNNNLDKKREFLKNEIYSYNEKIQKLGIDKDLKNQNKDIEELLNFTLNTLKDASKNWVKKFNNILEKEKFRSDLENYFIIIIFGKVNAGKSSLGNFIAQNVPKGEKVKFFKYDKAGKEETIQKLEEIKSDSFHTNNLECTVEIQGFKLNAMAWVDTPGLGSMSPENGELAREYIQSADYIIYPTSSDSPLQADEILQLKELFEQNKKVTICITKSDKLAKLKDEYGKYIKVDGKIAKVRRNKTLEDRITQEKYLKEEIEKINKNESLLGDIVSLSAHTAKLGLEENDEKLFIESNIPKFYELITEVVKEKASKLKSETPYNSLKSFIDNDILGITDKPNPLTIKIIREKIDDLEKNIRENLNQLDILISNIKSDLSREIEAIVAKYYMEINKSNAENMFKKIDTEISENISKIVEENIKKAFENFSYSFDNLNTALNGNDFKIDDVYAEYTYTTKNRNKSIGSAILGGLATIGAGFFTEGGAWIVAIRSILAGGTGGYIGGKIGEMTGSEYTSKVNIGDNKDEVIQKFKEAQILVNEENTKKIYEDIKKQFFIPLQETIRSIRLEIDNFEKSINSFKGELK